MRREAILGPLLLFVVWYLVGSLGFVDNFFLPDPFLTLRELWIMFVSGDIERDLGATLIRVMTAFLIALVGIPLGLMLGSSKRIYSSVEFVIDFFRSIPATALFPLFLIFFGVTDLSKIAVAGFASVLIVIFNTAYGVMNASTYRLLAARLMGASHWQIFYKILLWESLPQVFIGLRSAISLSLVIIVVTEMFIGTDVGLGKRIIDYQIMYEITSMYGVILLAGTVGYMLNLVFLSLEKRLLHWKA